jgi:hypothetical protein
MRSGCQSKGPAFAFDNRTADDFAEVRVQPNWLPERKSITE